MLSALEVLQTQSLSGKGYPLTRTSVRRSLRSHKALTLLPSGAATEVLRFSSTSGLGLEWDIAWEPSWMCRCHGARHDLALVSHWFQCCASWFYISDSKVWSEPQAYGEAPSDMCLPLVKATARQAAIKEVTEVDNLMLRFLPWEAVVRFWGPTCKDVPWPMAFSVWVGRGEQRFSLAVWGFFGHGGGIIFLVFNTIILFLLGNLPPVNGKLKHNGGICFGIVEHRKKRW